MIIVVGVCSWVRNKRCSLVLIALFLMVQSITGASAMDSTSASTTLYALLMPSVIISPNVNPCIWEIKLTSPGIYTKTLDLHILANTNWQLSVKDEDSNSSGFMREWMGDRYGYRRLSIPLKISADKDLNLADANVQPIKEGKMTGEKGADVQVTLTQVVTPEDMRLLEGNIYSKCLAFIVSPQSGS